MKSKEKRSCVAKAKKPWYRRWWVYVLAAVILLSVVGCNQDSPAAEPEDGRPAITDSVELPAAAPEGLTEAAETTGADAEAAEQPEMPSVSSESGTADAESAVVPDSSATTAPTAAPFTPTEPADAPETPITPSEETAAPASSQATEPAAQQPDPSPQPVEEPEASEVLVWIPNTGSKYHRTSTCSGMKNPRQVPISQAVSMGFEPCKRCY